MTSLLTAHRLFEATRSLLWSARGASRPGYPEQIDVGEELHRLMGVPNDEPRLHLVGPNQWPVDHPGLRDTGLAYQSNVHRVALQLLKSFSEVAEDSLASIVDDITALPAV